LPFALVTHLFFQELKKCFDAQDIPLLQETIANLPEEDARYHMKRCIDSGLWVPQKNSDGDKETECDAEASGE
jgi:cell division cycle protein 37